MPEIRVGFAADFDPAVLADYFRKREDWYERRIGVDAEVAGQDEYDDRSHIVIATDGTQCLGGLRATVRRPGDTSLLPCEAASCGLRIAELFPDLDLAATSHAELSRLVIAANGGALPFGNDIAFRLLHFLLRERMPEPDVRYAFVGSSRAHAPLYRMLGRKMAPALRTLVRPIPLERVPAPYRELPGGDRSCILAFDLEARP